MAINSGKSNLIPFSKRTKEEARESGRKGGIISGETRRRKADLRDTVQAFLTGEYTLNSNGDKGTGAEWFMERVMDVLQNPKNPNWKAAAELVVSLSDSGKAGAEVERIQAETEYTKAKTKLLRAESEDDGAADDGLIDALKNAAAERGKRGANEG